VNGVFATWLVSGSLAVAAADASPPTFSRDVAPIVFRHCVTCHHPGTNGAFSLVAYSDVRPRARAIAAAVASRYMPPWKPEDGYSDELAGRRRLTDTEIDTIGRWAASGAPEGDAAALPAPPRWADGWRLGKPDLVVRMPEAFDVPASGPDIFRIFVVPIPADAPRYVKAIEFVPGTPVVHHANVRLDETRMSRRLDESDPRPGYDGLLARTAHFPDGYFFGWTPGQLATGSDDFAWRLNPGTDMVLQLHLRPTGRPEHVRASIGLYFASGPPRLTPVMLRLGKQDIDIPSDQRDYVATDSYVLPVDVEVHGVQPHAHYRARDVIGFATLPNQTTKGLIHIPDWDFDWQDTYQYLKPFVLPKGTTLTMRYTYDNSATNRRNPQLPPQRVHWGQNSSDEMGDLWIQVVPRSPADLDLLTRDVRQKVFREDILGYETVLRRTPDEVSLHDDVAMLYMAVGGVNEAITHFSESARLTPGVAVTHFNLGTALAAAGRREEAIGQFRSALQISADYAYARNNLGSLLLAKGEVEEARSQFERALTIDPRYAEAHNNLGRLLAYEGQTDEAARHLTQALALREDYAEAHFNLARVLLTQNRASAAVAHYLRASALMPDWLPVLGELAWTLATDPSADARDAGKAVLLAERAAALTKRQDSAALDVLAAAYAATGRFDEAVAVAQQAADLAQPKSPEAVAEIGRRLALYRQRQPYIDTRRLGPVSRRP
jgi:tetratricopeptide (TPR) repeat protein/mono/diheme cytochrome c family protein